jgi:hypothetical protein
VLCLVFAAVAFALAEVLDAAWLRLAGVVFIVLVFFGKELWTWRGAGREFVASVSAMVLAVVIAYVLERLAG